MDLLPIDLYYQTFELKAYASWKIAAYSFDLKNIFRCADRSFASLLSRMMFPKRSTTFADVFTEPIRASLSSYAKLSM